MGLHVLFERPMQPDAVEYKLNEIERAQANYERILQNVMKEQFPEKHPTYNAFVATNAEAVKLIRQISVIPPGMHRREFLHNETALTALRDISDRIRQQLEGLMNTTTYQLLDEASHW